MSHFLTNTDVGTAIAYFPKLARWLKNVNAAVFLGQFIYWHDKTSNPLGVYKTAEEIEEETGLSVYEQRAARKILKGLGFITETYKRISHKMYYKFNVETFKVWLAINSSKEVPSRTKPTSPCGQNPLREVDKREVDIQKSTTETTTENLATPFRSEDLGNSRGTMKISGNTSILDSLKKNMPKKKGEGKVNISVLSSKWKEIRAEATQGYSPELTGKELGFLKLILRDFESRSLEALNYIALNWAIFAEKACQSAGIGNRPTKPNLGFLAQNRAVLWELLQGSNTQEQKTEVASNQMATVVPEIGESDAALFDALK